MQELLKMGTQHFPAESKNQNMSNVMVHTNLNTTNTLHGVAKVIASLTLPGWKPSRVNHALIPSNASIVEATIKLTLIFVFLKV